MSRRRLGGGERRVSTEPYGSVERSAFTHSQSCVNHLLRVGTPACALVTGGPVQMPPLNLHLSLSAGLEQACVLAGGWEPARHPIWGCRGHRAGAALPVRSGTPPGPHSRPSPPLPQP